MRRLTRRTFGGLLGVSFAGCLDDSGDVDEERGSIALEPATQQGDIRLTSPAFDDGGSIPRPYGYEAANVNPPLEIDGVSDAAEALALVVDDPDAVEPAGKIWVHWLVWNLPPETTEIPEDWTPDTAIEGENDFGEVGYGGPNPPDEEHTYRFKLYALETPLEVGEGATVDELEAAMEGRVIARTQLRGTYAP